MHTMSEHEGVI